jgi:hypothetical protein
MSGSTRIDGTNMCILSDSRDLVNIRVIIIIMLQIKKNCQSRVHLQNGTHMHKETRHGGSSRLRNETHRFCEILDRFGAGLGFK